MSSAVSYQIVLTKADQVKASELEKRIAETAAALAKRPAAFPEIIVTSSREGTGMPELRATIVRLMESAADQSRELALILGDAGKLEPELLRIDAIRAHHRADQRIGQHLIECQFVVAVSHCSSPCLGLDHAATAALRSHCACSLAVAAATAFSAASGPYAVPSTSITSTSVMPRKPSTLLRYGTWKSSAVLVPRRRRRAPPRGSPACR